MRRLAKEPNTIAYITNESPERIPIDGDGITQVTDLLADPAVWRVDPCCESLSTAVDLVDVIRSNPNTLLTAARVSYAATDGIQTLPITTVNSGCSDAREAAVKSFLSAYVADEDGASLARSELFDAFFGWHLNLAGRSMSRPSFGRVLATLGVDQHDGFLRNCTWTEEVLEILEG